MIEAVKLAQFAEKNGWIVIAQADEGDKKIGDDFIQFLTPFGKRVLVKFYSDGSIRDII